MFSVRFYHFACLSRPCQSIARLNQINSVEVFSRAWHAKCVTRLQVSCRTECNLFQRQQEARTAVIIADWLCPKFSMSFSRNHEQRGWLKFRCSLKQVVCKGLRLAVLNLYRSLDFVFVFGPLLYREKWAWLILHTKSSRKIPRPVETILTGIWARGRRDV